jgi:hypothetical protein
VRLASKQNKIGVSAIQNTDAAESLLWKKANRAINAIHRARTMTVELRTLALNAVLGLGQIVLGSQLTGRDA